MKKRKPSAIDKILRSSSSPESAINKAFNNLSPNKIPVFLSVALKNYLFERSCYRGLVDIEAKDIKTIGVPRELVDRSDDQIFYFSFGILFFYRDYLENFVRLERVFEDELLLGSYNKAEEVLDEIEKNYGSSFWLENNKISLSKLMGTDVNHKYSNVSDLAKLFLKQHGFNLDELDGESITKSFISQLDVFENQVVRDIAAYRFLGYNPEADFDRYKVLAIEFNSSLIDVYKAFEFLVLEMCLKGTGCDKEYDGLSFLNSIGHRYYGLVDTSACKYFDSRFFDSYTSSNYESVFDEFGNIDDDLGVVYILSKTVSYMDVRYIPSCFLHRIINYLADVVRKKNNFESSFNVLGNICWAFRFSSYFYGVYNFLLSEVKADGFVFGYDLSSVSAKFSNINTPLKCYLVQGEVSPLEGMFGSTYNNFNNVLLFGSTDDVPKELDIRQVKYIGRRLVGYGRYQDAIDLYEENDISHDCEMKRDYMFALCKNGKTLNALKFFVELVRDHEGALEYFAINDLYERAIDEISSVKAVELPLVLYWYGVINNNSINKNATAMALANYVRYKGLSVPSDLSFSDDDLNVVEFLEHVCNRDILVKSMLFRYQVDAFDERIKICNLLSSRKIGNTDKLVFESKELSKRKVLDSAAKQVSSSKVYADIDFVRTKTWDEFSECYNDYISCAPLDDIYEKSLAEIYLNLEKGSKESSVNNEFVNILSNQLSAYLSIPDKRSKYLFSMIKCVVEEYCFGIKGLNVYLSTRVRHGTLLTTLLGPAIDEGVVSEEAIDFEAELVRFMPNVSKDVLDELSTAHNIFNKDIISLVRGFRDETIQVTANGKGTVDNAFNFNVDAKDLYRLRSSLNEYPSINECWELINHWLEERLSQACKRVHEEIEHRISEDLAKITDRFISRVEKISSEYSVPISREFISRLAKVRKSFSSQLSIVKGWFVIDSAIDEREYTFDIVTDIAGTMLMSNSIEIVSTAQMRVSHKALSPLVDIVYNLLSNAMKHSVYDKKQLRVGIEAVMDSGSIVLSMTNSTFFDGDIVQENVRLRKYTEGMNDRSLQDLLQKEGGSGVAKISSILKHELGSKGVVKLAYLDSETFCSSITISLESGVILNENTNS
ncbi:hypothetical protein [Halobacteriovorax sp.]|uniref:hypothetical protein n=1 Tax=Halobacteriovorax sp. TaxID=2020862 RepID=UPI003AF2A49B